jgi:hypothetical protein
MALFDNNHSKVEAWNAFMAFLPGAHLIYAGQEVAATHTPSLFEIEPVPWHIGLAHGMGSEGGATFTHQVRRRRRRAVVRLGGCAARRAHARGWQAAAGRPGSDAAAARRGAARRGAVGDLDRRSTRRSTR